MAAGHHRPRSTTHPLTSDKRTAASPPSALRSTNPPRAKRAAFRAALPEGVLARQRLADDEGVHLVRAFVRQHRLEVVHVPDDRVLERDAVAAEDRARGAAHLERAADV